MFCRKAGVDPKSVDVERARQAAELRRQDLERQLSEKRRAAERERARTIDAIDGESSKILEKQKDLERKRTRDGLVVSRFEPGSDGVIISMRSVSEETASFDWRHLRAKRRDDSISKPVHCEPTTGERNHYFSPKEMRTFRVRFDPSIPSNWIEDIAWAEGVFERELASDQ